MEYKKAEVMQMYSDLQDKHMKLQKEHLELQQKYIELQKQRNFITKYLFRG
jgi:uncharacterized protein YlxW (UPF0749 family)